jgi:hypothetical protein
VIWQQAPKDAWTAPKCTLI